MSQEKTAELRKMNTEAALAGSEDPGSTEGGSRYERRKQQEREQDEQEREGKQKKRKYRVRLIPIWLRLIIVIFLLAASLAVGAMVGYGVVGNGNPTDVFQKSTWQHIHDVIYKDVK